MKTLEDLKKLAEEKKKAKHNRTMELATKLELLIADLNNLIDDAKNERIDLSADTMEDLLKTYLEFGCFNPR
jgi:hypothetical protein